jgi:hypothetical protein
MNNAAADGGIYADGRTYAEHVAWLDSFTGHEYMMVHMPIGRLMDLAYIAHFKYALLSVPMSANDRLRFLDFIARCIDRTVTAEAIAAIEPACATSVETLHQLNGVPRSETCRVFQEGDVFRLLARLNPSLYRALELCEWPEPIPQGNREPLQ